MFAVLAELLKKFNDSAKSKFSDSGQNCGGNRGIDFELVEIMVN